MTDNTCPAILRKVLDLSEAVEKTEEQLYSDFLLECEKTANIKDKGILDIKLSSRLTEAGAPCNGVNSSLALIFDFYAKLQDPQTQMQKKALTYDEIQRANETLSFYEMLLMMRDFDILPKLITKDELIFLWKVGNIQNITAGKGPLRMLTFREFIDMLTKVAIFSYNKPGLRQVVIKLNGDMLTPLEQVQSLAAYLHLEDYERVRSIIRTVGVETATLLHNRSVGEKNYRTMKYLKDDLRGARMADYLSRGGKSTTQNDHKGDINPDIDGNDPIAYRIGSALQRNIHGLGEFADAKNSLGSGDMVLEKGENSRMESIMKSIHESESMYLSSAVGKIYHKQDDNALCVDKTPDTLPIKGLYVPRVHLSELQERALVQYHPALSKELLKYAVESSYSGMKSQTKVSSIPEENTVFEPSGAAFVDIGNISPGKECSIRIIVINRGSHETNIQVSTKGFIADELTVIKMPSAIAPGLRQVVVLKFLPPKSFVGGCKCTISMSSVTNSSSMLFQEEAVVHCPIYYYVSGDVKSGLSVPESSSRCTLRSLPSLLVLHGIKNNANSTDDLTLFSRTKTRPPINAPNVYSSAITTAKTRNSKTKRLSMSHSLR